jgi:ligand-binding sensor domain-containing protein
VLALFEDREGTIWVATTGGLDRFRELPVTTITTKQGLSSDATQSVLAARDGSIWVGAVDGVARLRDGRATIFRNGAGLPDAPHSLYEDPRGVIWVATRRGVASFTEGRFVTVDTVPGGEMHHIAGDATGHLWLAEHQSFLHVLNGRVVERIPWEKLGRRQTAAALLPAREPGGVWLGFWIDGGVSYFRDGRFQKSFTAKDGLGQGPVSDLRQDADGAIWAATHEGGISRILDGRVTTLSSRNGLPCDAVHWTMEDGERSLWLYAACGLVRIARGELEAWFADTTRRVSTTTWEAAGR